MESSLSKVLRYFLAVFVAGTAAMIGVFSPVTIMFCDSGPVNECNNVFISMAFTPLYVLPLVVYSLVTKKTHYILYVLPTFIGLELLLLILPDSVKNVIANCLFHVMFPLMGIVFK